MAEKGKPRENRKETAIKQGMIIALIAAIIVLLAAFYFFRDLIIQNILWLVILAAFILIVWKGDLLVRLEEHERAVIYRVGRVTRVGGPGWTLVIPGIEHYKVVDVRTKTVDIPPQQVITKDNIKLTVDAVIYLGVNKDPESVIKSVVAIKDYELASSNYIKGVIRDVIGEMTLSEVISNIDVLNSKLMSSLAAITKDWGIKVDSVAITDVVIPETILAAMHAEKAAHQERLAKKQKSEAIKYEISAIREAASKLDDKTLAYYYLEALKKLGEGQATKFIFPMELSRLAGLISGKLGGSVPREQVETELLDKYKDVIKGFLEARKETPAEKPAKAPKERTAKPKKKASKKQGKITDYQ